MFVDSHDLFVRFGAARAGRHLIAICEAALPVTVVSTSVIAQEKKGIPLLDEFILRAVRLGQVTTHRIAQLSGVDESLIQSGAAGLAAEGKLIYGVQGGVLALTPMGEKTAIELATVVPVQRQFKVCFDRTLWCVKDYDAGDLMTKSQARDVGLLLLPAFKSSRIGEQDITVSNLNSVVRQGNVGPSAVDILRITKLSGNTHRYLPAQILVYVDSATNDIELALVVGDDLSQEHELSLISLSVATRLGIEVVSDLGRPKLTSELEVAREATSLSMPSGLDASSLSHVAPVVGFQHRVLLEKALTAAKKRLLITTHGFDQRFLKSYVLPKFSELLERGVTVRVAVVQSDDGETLLSMAQLNKLLTKYPAALSIIGSSGLDANSLIFDDTWVETSFGWFDGTPQPPTPLPLHEGTLIQGQSYADARYLGLLDEVFTVPLGS